MPDPRSSSGSGPSLWRIVADAVRAASPAQRRGLAWSPLPIVVALVLSVGDVLEGTDLLEAGRLVGLLLASGAYTLLLVAHVLHHISQHGVAGCVPGTGRQRWPFAALQSQHPDRIFQALPVMALLSTAMATAAIGLYVPSFFARPITLVLLPFFGFLVVLGIRAAGHISRFLYRYGEQQAQLAARAREEATEAQLTALQAQMNPHFLFNALNTVAALVRTSPRTAEATVEHLADVLRRTLARSTRTSGTVAEELDYLKAYLAVEQQRFGDRLAVEWNVDPEVLRCPLPPLVLQPLVENALRHGLGSRLEGGRLRIEAVRHNGGLQFTVSDDGAGLPSRMNEGTGLGNLRQRLSTLYGEDAVVILEPAHPGTRARLRVPVRS